MTTQTQAHGYVFNEENAALFIQNASILANNKISYNREQVKKLQVMKRYCTLAQQCLGKDYGFLQDGASTRLYIKDVFGMQALRFFEDNRGEIILDIEHMLVLYYWLKSQNSPLLNTALGILYFITAHQLDDEFSQISKVAPNNQIKPLFELSPKLFRWKRCNFVLRKYMLPLTLDVDTNERGFYYEMPNVNQVSYLIHKGYSVKDARDYMNNMENGLFFTYLPKDVENMLLPSILSGEITPYAMDGYFKQSLISDFEEIAQEYTINNVYNVYTHFIKPIQVDLMGVIIRTIQEELKGNRALLGDSARIHHVSPARIGVAINDGVPSKYMLENIFPNMYKFMREVKPVTHFDLLMGEHLY